MDGYRSVTVVCIDDAELATLSRSDYLDLMRTSAPHAVCPPGSVLSSAEMNAISSDPTASADASSSSALSDFYRHLCVPPAERSAKGLTCLSRLLRSSKTFQILDK